MRLTAATAKRPRLDRAGRPHGRPQRRPNQPPIRRPRRFAVTNAENFYDHAGQDPINGYDLDGLMEESGADFAGGSPAKPKPFDANQVLADILNLFPGMPEPKGDVMVRPQANGKGWILYEPGTVDPYLCPEGEMNNNIIRVYQDANGNWTMRYYNGRGQPLDPLTGKIGSQATTHIPEGYNGPYMSCATSYYTYLTDTKASAGKAAREGAAVLATCAIFLASK